MVLVVGTCTSINIMNIVTPSHSNDTTEYNRWIPSRSSSIQHDPLFHAVSTDHMTATEDVTSVANSNSTTGNAYLDAVWLQGRKLTDMEWDELRLLKVCFF
jgi:hypothetical protein